MFDLAFSEIAIIAIVAVVVIGPKELPRALATAGRWMGKARGVMNNFRTGLDAMVREAELQEMEKKWTAENDRIMREHPAGSEAEPQMEALAAPASEQAVAADNAESTQAHSEDGGADTDDVPPDEAAKS